MLTGKKVLVGVTGGIAAYKAVEIVSRLRKLGAEVHVVMTEAATRLVAPLTFQAMSGNPVEVDLLGEQKRWPVEHVYLGKGADLYCIAPCTANTIANLAAGMAGDFVAAMALTVTCPLLVAPAMETHMWEHPLTQANVERLRQVGYQVLEPAAGRLASGFTGKGRMPEPEEIVQAIVATLTPRQDLAGLPVLITAGATREAMDPVRYLTNRSSGKMGYALAEAAAARGALVTLVSGPVALPDPPGVQVVRVQSALDMHAACLQAAETARVVVAAAAVADYRFKAVSPSKLKKQGETMTVELVKNPDIIADIARNRRPDQLLVGFAAETDNVVEYARGKLANKGLDLVVANNVGEPGSGFGTDTNRVTLVSAEGAAELPLAPKHEVATAIWDWIAGRL